MKQFSSKFKQRFMTTKSTRERAIERIGEEAYNFGFCKQQVAYILATVQHETNNTFLPVKEAYWLSEEWRMKNLRYAPFYGRGYIQITHKYNYEKFGRLLNLDLVAKPDLTLNEEVALAILLHGMKLGLFTGKSLDDYTVGETVDFIKARQVVNGKDKAALIAGYARKWLAML